MRRLLLTAVAFAALATFHYAFLVPLGGPLRRIDLPLIGIVALIASFKFSDAYVAAFTVGAVAEAIFPGIPGLLLISRLLVARLTVALFLRVFTGASLVGVLALNAAAFGISAILGAASSAIEAGSFSSPLLLRWSMDAVRELFTASPFDDLLAFAMQMALAFATIVLRRRKRSG